MRNGTRARFGRVGRRWAGVLVLAVLPMGGCEDTGATASAAAVDHVASVLADAGRAPARLESAVRPECSPTDAFLGVHLTSDPLHVEVAYADVAAVVADLGTELPPADEDPTAGAPAHVDHHETSGAGWRVRWGESHVVETAEGAPATTITFVDGGEVDDDDLDRWEQEGTITDAGLYVCG